MKNLFWLAGFVLGLGGVVSGAGSASAIASPVQVRGAGAGKASARGSGARSKSNPPSPIEKKCATGFADLQKWKTRSTAQLAATQSGPQCQAQANAIESNLPPPPVQCQYLTYAEASEALKIQLGALVEGTFSVKPKAQAKMSAVFGDARGSLMHQLYDRCDALRDAAESRAATGSGSGRSRSAVSGAGGLGGSNTGGAAIGR